MSNLNCYYAEDCRFDYFFGWLRVDAALWLQRIGPNVSVATIYW